MSKSAHSSCSIGACSHILDAYRFPLAQYQQVHAVADFPPLEDLAVVHVLRAANPAMTDLDAAKTLAGMLGPLNSGILHLHIPVGIVEEPGATLVQ